MQLDIEKQINRERENLISIQRERERESSTLTLIAQQTQRCKREKDREVKCKELKCLKAWGAALRHDSTSRRELEAKLSNLWSDLWSRRLRFRCALGPGAGEVCCYCCCSSLRLDDQCALLLEFKSEALSRRCAWSLSLMRFFFFFFL